MTVPTIADRHPLIVKNITWQDEASTESFAQALARRPAIGRALIELQGDLGAGKTTFARHLLKSLGVQGRIKSPTYAVVEAYTLEGPEQPPGHNCAIAIWHFDFYRFNDPSEWEEAGFRDIFASPGLKLVEWPQKAGAHLPVPDLVIQIGLQDDESRLITLTAYTPTGTELIA
ncbi:MAG: tRNA (adenosine(37)-N6)-threonylcarbamoyltransferase complex ATPase subunit type 1 TsaE [Pseudomonadota bacterium]|nr:tRNA (adenosine(37)-N6)-threonylcarbamoyltransferase complex ATPase subunit type 1 TsaE [Pseudomonadota bacterium]